MKLCFLSCGPIGGFKSSLYAHFSYLLEQGNDLTLIILKLPNSNIEIKDIDPKIKTKIIQLDIPNDFLKGKNLFNFTYLKLYLIKRFYWKIKNKKIKLKYGVFYNQVYGKFIVEKCKKYLDLTEYDAVISWEEIFCNYFLANNVKSNLKIGFIHPDYDEAHFSKKVDSKFLKKLNAICLVSESNYKSFIKRFRRLGRKAHIVHNVLDTKKIDVLSKERLLETFDGKTFNIVTVCRLDNVSKALDRALLICKKLNDNNFRFVWRFVGDGDYRCFMEKFINENKLNHCIKLLGNKQNPFPYVLNSDLFVLQSYYEGYPMSVLESLYLKTPVLITDFASSNELVKDNVNGFIVENKFDAIYDKISMILSSHNKNLINTNFIDNFQNNCFELAELLQSLIGEK